MQTRIDHFVIGAETLTQGVEYVRENLGVDIPFGGVHIKMGTHNHLMQLGNSIFLEVIAIKHDIEPPNRPRWFGLDDPFVRQQIAVQPTLLTWVINTKNINKLLQQAASLLGTPELISRGDISWYFGLPEDGRIIAGGILPYAIEWHTKKHPSKNMANLDCKFQYFEIYHPHVEWLQSMLASIGALDLVKINSLPKNNAPYMTVCIKTPSGIKKLSSCANV